MLWEEPAGLEFITMVPTSAVDGVEPIELGCEAERPLSVLVVWAEPFELVCEAE